MHEAQAPGTVWAHDRRAATAEKGVAVFERGQRLAGRGIYNVEVIENIDQKPFSPLTIEHCGDRVPVSAKTVEREGPLRRSLAKSLRGRPMLDLEISGKMRRYPNEVFGASRQQQQRVPPAHGFGNGA